MKNTTRIKDVMLRIGHFIGDVGIYTAIYFQFILWFWAVKGNGRYILDFTEYGEWPVEFVLIPLFTVMALVKQFCNMRGGVNCVRKRRI